jgi:hypothetical protein
MRTFPFFETLGADICFATRSLMKNPAFLVVVVLSLASAFWIHFSIVRCPIPIRKT